MSSKLGLGLILSISAAAVLLTSCVNNMTDPLHDKIKNHDVYLQVKGNPKEIVIDEEGSTKCLNNSVQQKDKFGCIDVAIGDQAVVTFKLRTGSWHMEEMIICKGSTKSAQNCKLDTTEQREFSIMRIGELNRYPPNEFGVIKLSAIDSSMSEFKLIDLNTLKGDYFYTLIACKNNSTDCAKSDPPIRNRGIQN